MPRSLLLLVAVLALAGCRESITGPDSTPPLFIPDANAESIYVKGPATINLNNSANYRAEPLSNPAVDRYEWTYYGPGLIAAESVDPQGQNRLIEAHGVQEGALVIVVRAYDAEGTRLASGSKEIMVTSF